MTMEALMLKEPWTVEEVVTRGLKVDAPEEAEIAIFDSSFAFVRMKVHSGVADQVLFGPYQP